MHHASYNGGAGWCVYDDWMLALRKLRHVSGGRIQKAMMIDLDVHQVPAPGHLLLSWWQPLITESLTIQCRDSIGSPI